ncbi:XRE family transcriptional regulator [Robbsia sp. KACC 23696]|uniref:helix-turn-helix domain-containing protein n=1 Tax=Robbsia sp. KACC 23696 TaxID=3149231 RepID=UPI00325BFC73
MPPSSKKPNSVTPALSPLVLDPQTVGARLRSQRKAHNLTLAALSARSGIAVSTISKAERGDIALTYDKFAALAQALHIDFDEIFGRGVHSRPAREVTPTLTRSGEQAIYDTPNYEYGMLAHTLTGKRMIPMRAHIHARKVEDFTEYVRHAGEEFVFVLSGKLRLQFEDGNAYTLARGDSLYFNSAIGHVYLSASKDDAEVLVCCVDADAHRPEGVI